MEYSTSRILQYAIMPWVPRDAVQGHLGAGCHMPDADLPELLDCLLSDSRPKVPFCSAVGRPRAKDLLPGHTSKGGEA